MTAKLERLFNPRLTLSEEKTFFFFFDLLRWKINSAKSARDEEKLFFHLKLNSNSQNKQSESVEGDSVDRNLLIFAVFRLVVSIKVVS